MTKPYNIVFNFVNGHYEFSCDLKKDILAINAIYGPEFGSRLELNTYHTCISFRVLAAYFNKLADLRNEPSEQAILTSPDKVLRDELVRCLDRTPMAAY